MSAILAQDLLHQALALPAIERATLVDGLVRSLDQPDARLDALWLAEAEDRLRAYRAGELKAVDAAEVFAALERND